MYSSADVMDAAGITPRQLEHAVRRGYLRPERDRGGSGTPRRWPTGEFEIARRMGRLTAAGLRPGRAAEFARNSWPAGDLGPGLRLTCDITTDDAADDCRAGLRSGGYGPLPAAEPAGMPSHPVVGGMPAQPDGLAAWKQAEAARAAAQRGDGARRRRAAVQPGYQVGGNRRPPPQGGGGSG